MLIMQSFLESRFLRIYLYDSSFDSSGSSSKFFTKNCYFWGLVTADLLFGQIGDSKFSSLSSEIMESRNLQCLPIWRPALCCFLNLNVGVKGSIRIFGWFSWLISWILMVLVVYLNFIQISPSHASVAGRSTILLEIDESIYEDSCSCKTCPDSSISKHQVLPSYRRSVQPLSLSSFSTSFSVQF